MATWAEADIIYDWNAEGKRAPLAPGPFALFDETLRDGIQSPSVRDPSIEDKLLFTRGAFEKVEQRLK